MSAAAKPRTGALAGLALALCLAGCEDPPPPPENEDRALSILKQEVERAQRGEAVGRAPDQPQDPNQALAGLAAQDARPRELPLPEENATVHVRTLALKLAGLSAGHSVKGPRVELTTESAFLGVRLLAQNVGKKALLLDLSGAQVVDGMDRTFPVARDAQRAAGTRDLSRQWPVEGRVELTLYFEVPPEVVGGPLRLVFAKEATGAEKDVTIPLH